MRMRPIHGVVVATAVGAAAAFGASAVKNTTHLGAAAQAQSGQKVDGIVRARSRKLDAEETALRKARRYHTPKLPSVPAAPHSIPSYAYAAAPQPVAVPPPPSAKAAPVRHLTLTRVVHRHVHHKPASEPKTTSTETTPTTTTTEETQPTPTTVTTTSQPPVTKTTSSTTSSQEPGDDSGHDDSHDDGGSGGDS